MIFALARLERPNGSGYAWAARLVRAAPTEVISLSEEQ
jgi:hypothetical protein